MGSNSRCASIAYFYKNVIESSSEEESDGETEILLAAASMAHDHLLLPRRRGGSSKKRTANIDRGREDGHLRLYEDYFDPNNAIFKEKAFRRCYRMRRDVFLWILNGVREYDDYFDAKLDCTGKVGFSSYQKCYAALRQLAYGVPGNLIDDYMRMSETTCHEAMYRFCDAIIAVFGEEYLREPNAEDTACLLSINESRGFPRMLGSIDYMHWQWKNCPFAWQWQFKGPAEGCTVILEAVASHDLWIWRSFFGMAGSNNDINVLQRSSIFARLAEGNAPQITYQIRGNTYDKGYYLADGIYPSWSNFVKTIRNPADEKCKRFAKEQEAARKVMAVKIAFISLRLNYILSQEID